MEIASSIISAKYNNFLSFYARKNFNDPKIQEHQKPTIIKKHGTMEAHLPSQASRRPPTELGETRHKNLHKFNSNFIYNHNNTTQLFPRLYTQIQHQNQEHGVKVGSPRGECHIHRIYIYNLSFFNLPIQGLSINPPHTHTSLYLLKELKQAYGFHEAHTS